MGGDQGPHVTLPAAILAVANLPHLHLLLCGDETVIVKAFEKAQIYPHPRITIFPTTEIVAMNDKPIFALRHKKKSSMRKALDLVQDGSAQACVSAGNTGALFSMAHFVLKTLPGVERPALISALPTNNPKQHVFMLDLGANVFCDSSVLYQFAIMGSVMAKEVDGIERPKVALLNMGEEDNKGSDHIKQTASYLLANENINYIGFIEGNDIFTNKADVIVCDGFVGNVALKTCEGVARMVYKQLQEIIKKHFLAQVMGKLLSKTLKKLFKPMNPDQYNGASLIGLRGIVVKSHGNASVTAFYTAIIEAVTEVERQVPTKIKDQLEDSFCHKD
jgi:glycerol-3-phosphate acyltransferase PlsX